MANPSFNPSQATQANKVRVDANLLVSNSKAIRQLLSEDISSALVSVKCTIGPGVYSFSGKAFLHENGQIRLVHTPDPEPKSNEGWAFLADIAVSRSRKLVVNCLNYNVKDALKGKEAILNHQFSMVVPDGLYANQIHHVAMWNRQK